MKRSFGAWEKTDCDECGNEYQVTRTQSKEFDHCICGDCEIYARAYAEGYKHGQKQSDYEAIRRMTKNISQTNNGYEGFYSVKDVGSYMRELKTVEAVDA